MGIPRALRVIKDFEARHGCHSDFSFPVSVAPGFHMPVYGLRLANADGMFNNSNVDSVSASSKEGSKPKIERNAFHSSRLPFLLVSSKSPF